MAKCPLCSLRYVWFKSVVNHPTPGQGSCFTVGRDLTPGFHVVKCATPGSSRGTNPDPRDFTICSEKKYPGEGCLTADLKHT